MIVLSQLVYPPPVRTTGTALPVGAVESEEEGVWWLIMINNTPVCVEIRCHRLL